MLSALTLRTTRSVLRAPTLALTPVAMSVFFLAVYAGQLGAAGGLMLGGEQYLDFILPLVLLTTAFNGGALAGLLLVEDMTSGYHRRLLLTRAGSSRLIAAPLLAGAGVLVAQSSAVFGVAWLLGMRDTTLTEGLALIFGTSLAGVGFSLLGAAAAVRFGTVAAVNSTVFAFFPLSFMTSAFAPRAELTGWMGGIATVNPLTYLLEGLRTVGGGIAPPGAVPRGTVVLAALLVAGLATCALALRSARRAR